jgi:hypothetical protein
VKRGLERGGFEGGYMAEFSECVKSENGKTGDVGKIARESSETGPQMAPAGECDLYLTAERFGAGIRAGLSLFELADDFLRSCAHGR